MSEPGIALARVGGSYTLEEIEALSLQQHQEGLTRSAEEARAKAAALAAAQAEAARLSGDFVDGSLAKAEADARAAQLADEAKAADAAADTAEAAATAPADATD